MTIYQKVQQTSVLYNLFSLPYIVPYLVGKVQKEPLINL